MIEIKDKQNCTGCTACEAICPRRAITMKEDSEGFLYPNVDILLCVECGLCNKVCQMQSLSDAGVVRSSYAVKHTNSDVLRESTSGGMFTALSDAVLAKGGTVYGAAFDKDMTVRHVRAVNYVDRNRMRGSKYVQSDVRGCFRQVQADLRQGKTVLFTGTPCQVDGLKRFLRGEVRGLICCDLICHGVPSPLILKEHFTLLRRKKRGNLVNYHFRPKKWGWHVHREIAVFENGKQYYSTPYADLWRNIYYGRLVNRPSCHSCRYTSLSRPGDLSIGDCRGIDNICPEFGSYDGVSLVLINTQIGQQIFEEICDNLVVEKINIDSVMQPPLREASKPGNLRKRFWEAYDEKGYQSALSVCFGKLYSLKYWVKHLLRRG